MALLGAGLAHALTRTWTGAGGNDNWSTAANWGGVIPAAGDDLVFSGSTRLTPINDLTPGMSFNSLSFSGGAGPFNVAGNAVVLAGGGSAVSSSVSSGNETISLNITFSTAAPTVSGMAGGLLVLNGTLANAGFQITAAASGNMEFNGAISGSGGLMKAGNGTLRLSGANTYSGATTVNGGVLRLNNADALGTTAGGTLVSAGAALDLNGLNYTNAEPLTLNGIGPSGIGALVNSSATGAAFAGLIALGSASSIVGESGTIGIDNTGTITGSYGLTLGGTQGGSLSSTLAGGILAKQGAGTWFLGGVSPLALTNLTLAAGTLNLGSGHVHTLSTSLTVSGGTLAFSSSTLQTAAATVDLSALTGVTPGSGTLEFTGASTQQFTPKATGTHPEIKQTGTGTTVFMAGLTAAKLTLVDGVVDIGTHAANVTLAGDLQMTGGTFAGAGGSLGVGGNLNVSAGGFTAPGSGGYLHCAGNATFATPVTFDANGGTLTLDGSAAGKLVDIAPHLFNLTVNNNSGAWSVSRNLLVDNNVFVSSGTLDIDTYAKNLTANGLTVNGGTLTAPGGNIAVAGDFNMTSGSLSAPDVGQTFTVAGSFTQTGGTIFPHSGTVALNGTGAGKSLGAVSALNVLAITNTGAWTATGAGFNVSAFSLGYGTLSLGTATTNTVTSTMTFSSAPLLAFGSSTLKFAGASLDLTNVGTLSPGAGTLEFTGTSAQNFTPPSAGTCPGIKQNGSGGTSISGYDLTTASLAIVSGTFHLVSGNHSVSTALSVTGGGLDFGSATLDVAAASVDFHLLSALNAGSGMLVFSGTSAQTFVPHASLACPALKQNGAGGTTVSTNGFTTPNLIVYAGTLHLGASLSHTAALFNSAGGGLDFGSSTLHLTGAGNTQHFENLASVTAGTGALSFDAVSGTQTFTATAAAFPDILHPGAGALIIGSTDLHCQSFTSSDGFLTLSGTAPNGNITTTGAFTLTNGNSATLTGLGAHTITVGGNATLTGATAADKLNLNPGSAWTLAASGSVAAGKATLGNANASVNPGVCSNCEDAAGNTNWTLPVVWSGAGGNQYWGTANNWSSQLVPTANQDVVFSSASGQPVALDANVAIHGITLLGSYTGYFNFNAHNLTLTGNADFRTGGSVSSGTGSLTFAGASPQTVYFPPGTLAAFNQTGAGGTTLLGTQRLEADTLYIAAGTLNLGPGLTHQINGPVSGTGGLDFGAANTVLYAKGDVNLLNLTVTAGSTHQLRFNGTGNQIYTPNASTPVPNIGLYGTGITTFNKPVLAATLTLASGSLNLGTSWTHTVSTTLTLSGGNLLFGSSALEIATANSDFHSLASLTKGAGTLKFTGASAQTFRPLAGAVFPGIVQYGTGGTTVVGDGITGSALTLNQGTFNLGSALSHAFTAISDGGGGPYGSLNFGSSTAHVSGNVSMANVPILTAGAGTLDFNGSGATQIFVPKGSGTVHPAITHTGADTVRVSTNALVCLGFYQSAGTWDFNGLDLATSGTGSFAVTNGTSASFANLGGRTLTSAGGAELAGQAGNRLDLNPGSAWTISVAGTLHASWADIANSNAANAAGGADSCQNLSGNSHWTFHDLIKPANVTAFTATALGGHAVAFAWTGSAAADADSVMLRYRTDGAYPASPGDGTLYRSVAKAKSADTATGLPDKTVFSFAAFARDSSGNYALPVAAAQDTARTPDVTPPANVTAFTAKALTSTTAELSWTPSVSADADSVLIRYRIGSPYPANTTDGAYYKTLSASRSKDTATGLTPGSIYWYGAFVRDSSGNYGTASGSAQDTMRYFDDRAPALSASDVPDSVRQNQGAVWTVDVGDPDSGDSLFTVTSGIPPWLSLSESADTARDGFAVHRVYRLTGTPPQAAVGNAALTVQVRDAQGKTFTFAKTVLVRDVNDAPVFSAGQDTVQAAEDSVVRFTPKYADPDPSDAHTLTLLQAPAWATLEDSNLAFRPGNRDVGPAHLRLTVSDGSLLDTLDMTIHVANVNDAPVAFPGAAWQSPAHWKEDAVDRFTVVVVDMDPGDPITLATPLPAWLTYTASVDSSRGYNHFFAFTAAPKQSDTGGYAFKLRFRDAAGAFSELPLAAKVAAVNDTPTAIIKGSQSLAGAARIGLDVSDEDGNAAATRFHYRLIGAAGDTVKRGICPSTVLDLHPLADGDYRLAVAAEDEGGLKQTGFTIAPVKITGATSLALDSARWNMIAYPGRALAAAALGAGAAITTWDESSEDGAPLGRYASGHASDSLARGKGYWARVAKPVTLSAPLADLLDRPVTLKLTHGKQGWNQIGNPYPYFIDLSTTGLQFWEWDAGKRDLSDAHGILKPWGAYWVQVRKDTALSIADNPYFPASGSLAKGAAAGAPGPSAAFRGAGDWTLQMSLQAGPYRDQANFLGVRSRNLPATVAGSPASAAGAAAPAGLTPDAPKFGDYIALHFQKPGESADSLRGYAADFRDNLGRDEEWWDFSVENSASGRDRASLTLPGLEALQAAGLHAFLVRNGESLPLTADAPAALAMEGALTHYSLVVTPHADFPERLRGDFSISQNFPNPVISLTTFRFYLPETWGADGKREARTYRMRLNVYDYSGRLAARVAEGGFKPGSHTLLWKPQAEGGGALAKGAYVYRLETAGFAKTLKLLIR